MSRGKVDPVAFGRRLDAERDAKGLDIKSLQEKVKQRTGGARGTGYATIWSYVNGKGPEEPRREIVEALADALDVLPEYLLSGRRPKNMSEKAAMAVRAELTPEQEAEGDRWMRLFRAMAEAEKDLPDLRDTWFSGRAEILEDLAIRLMSSGIRPAEDYADEQFVEALRQLAWLIMFPARAVGADDFLNAGAGRQYFLAMVTALEIAMPGPERGRPLNVVAGIRAAREAIGGAAVKGRIGDEVDGEMKQFMERWAIHEGGDDGEA